MEPKERVLHAGTSEVVYLFQMLVFSSGSSFMQGCSVGPDNVQASLTSPVVLATAASPHTGSLYTTLHPLTVCFSQSMCCSCTSCGKQMHYTSTANAPTIDIRMET